MVKKKDCLQCLANLNVIMIHRNLGITLIKGAVIMLHKTMMITDINLQKHVYRLILVGHRHHKDCIVNLDTRLTTPELIDINFG